MTHFTDPETKSSLAELSMDKVRAMSHHGAAENGQRLSPERVQEARDELNKRKVSASVAAGLIRDPQSAKDRYGQLCRIIDEKQGKGEEVPRHIFDEWKQLANALEPSQK